MRKKSTSPAGFTFAESIITLSIIGIFLALTWATVTFLLQKSNEQIVRTRGHFLAMEGIEIIKQIRQTAVNRNRETGFLEAIGNHEGRFVIETSGDEFILQKGSDQTIESTEDPYIDYCRHIDVTGASESIKQVISTVTWGSSNCNKNPHLISYSTYLADLRK